MSALFPRRSQRFAKASVACGALLACLLAHAAVPATNPSAPPAIESTVVNSDLDAPLFYEVLLGEIELNSGDAGEAYAVMLDAARRSQDDALFRRTVEIALQARAGNEALAAATAWRAALPRSVDAMRFQMQILLALTRPTEAMEPLGALLLATPPADRSAAIASVPRFMQRLPDHQQAATLIENLLDPYEEADGTRTAARVAVGRMWLFAGDTGRATALVKQAHKDDPASPAPIYLAIEMLPATPAIESVITDYLAQPKPDGTLRLAYVRALTSAERYPDAIAQLDTQVKAQPESAAAWLTLGALHLEMHQPKDAEAALTRYVGLAQAGKIAPAPAPASAVTSTGVAPTDTDDPDDDDDDAAPQAGGPQTDQGLIQAYMLLSQAAEMRNDFPAAEAWLAKVDSPARALEVQARRAEILARQGHVKEARALIQKVPERTPDDAKAKLIAEATVLRDTKHYKDAEEVLAAANQRFPDEPDLIYEQAMAEEKLDRMDAMERLLRHVIELKPDYQHAYNALGYSLADRNMRLPEAKALIQKALEISPGEPFITDSLGWVEYRMGHRAEALTLLRKAYSARPDTEIAAHLGEVLWVDGQHDEARKVLREARRRDNDNQALTEVLARLKVDL